MEKEKTDQIAAITKIHEPGESGESGESAPRTPKPGWKSFWTLTIITVVVVTAIFWKKHHQPAIPPAAPLTVAAVKVTREDLFNEVTIPAEFRPYVEVELHAKVSGYVDQMKVDFGDRVKSNQLLATIEVPELQDQLTNALAAQLSAQVDYTNANLLYTRLLAVNQKNPNLVAQQELDTAQSKNGSTAAAVAAATAEVGRYQTLVKYTQITAPFDGVVTMRYADPGTLIQGGMTSAAQAVVRVSDNYHLRLDFPVSVKYVKEIRLGQSVSVKVDSLGGKAYTGKITRFTDRVNEETRTMTTEIEVDNPTLEIIPGMYAAVVLKVGQRSQVLAIPSQAVSGEKDSTVYVINANHEVEARPVRLGLETPEKYEVTSGLAEGELVMTGTRTKVRPSQKVNPKLVSQPPLQ